MDRLSGRRSPFASHLRTTVNGVVLEKRSALLRPSRTCRLISSLVRRQRSEFMVLPPGPILLSRDIAMRKISAEPVPGTVLGLAAREAGRARRRGARKSSPQDRQSGAARGRRLQAVLGRVMAHEVGHLVLPIYSRSDRGFRRANIGVRTKGLQDFTTEQSVTVPSMLLGASSPHEGRSLILPSLVCSRRATPPA